MADNLFIFNSSMNRKRTTYICLFVLGFFIIDSILGSFSEWCIRRAKITVFSKARMSDFYSKKNIDLLFLGSSHSYRSFDPREFESSLHLQAFNLGSSGQNPTTSFFLLKEALRLEHPIKTLVIETYWETLTGEDRDFDSAAEVFYYMKSSKNKWGVFTDSMPFPDSLKSLSKAFQFRDILKDPRIYFGITPQTDGYKYEALGFVSKDGIAQPEKLKANPLRNKKIALNDYRLSYLKKTIELARTKGIRVILVTAPLPPTVMSEVSNYSEFSDIMSALSLEHSVEYVDFNILNTRKKIFFDRHFSDFNHLNNEGVKIITVEFLNHLKKI